MRISLLLPSLLVACGDKSADDTGATDTEPDVSSYETDDDGDGVSEADGDCDDADADIHPTAEELCDGVDNDCDGTIDDGAGDLVTFYWDHDGDGAGNTDDPVGACALPEGASDRPGDCDDLDASVHPAATEVCDGIDNDCDTLVDDADDSVDAATFTDFYPDADGDGFGDGTRPAIAACAAPVDAVADGTDCDDTSAFINPGMAEVCDTQGVDEDCDGLVDDADDSIYVASQTLWYPDADGDGFGDETDAGTALCVDPSTETDAFVDNADDCDDSADTSYPGAPEVCKDGLVNDCDGDAATAEAECQWNTDLDHTYATTVITPEEDDSFAWFAAAGDLDGDGVEDLVITSPWSSEGDGTGQGYVLHGPVTAATMDAGDDVQIDGLSDEDSSDTFGVDPVVADVDGDGYDDLWAGAPGLDFDDTSNYGGGFLLLGPITSGTTGDMAAGSVLGSGSNDSLGSGAAIVGDQDGDGELDLLLGDPSDGSSSNAGVVYLFSSSDLSGGTQISDADAIATISGEERWGSVGKTDSLASLGDVNGDGQGDIILGTSRADPYGNSGGAVYVFYGPVTGDLDVSDADATLGDSTADTSGLGNANLSGFDFDGDGIDDIGMGAYGSEHDAENGGAYYVAAGPVSGSVDLASDALLTIDGAEYEQIGGESDHGDLDGDGNTDLLVGAGYRTMGGNSAGSSSGAVALVVLGPTSGSLSSSDVTRISNGEDADDADFAPGVVVLGNQDGTSGDVAGVVDRTEDEVWYLFSTPTY